MDNTAKLSLAIVAASVVSTLYWVNVQTHSLNTGTFWFTNVIVITALWTVMIKPTAELSVSLDNTIALFSTILIVPSIVLLLYATSAIISVLTGFNPIVATVSFAAVTTSIIYLTLYRKAVKIIPQGTGVRIT